MIRSESSRERVLLRLIERQEQTIARLTEQVMALAGKPWQPEYETPSLVPDLPDVEFEIPEQEPLSEEM
jgi:hypothetical protein